MTMSSGIRISNEQREEFEKDPAALKGQGQIQAYFEHNAPITAQSQSFKYGGGQADLVMQVLDAVVPGTAKDFIKNELFDKMGITNYSWQASVSGLPESGWRVRMTSRAMVKWGTMVINKGRWNGEQLIPATFIARATSEIVPLRDDQVFFTATNISNNTYGYFWWQSDMKADNKSYLSKYASGGGGQYIMVIEELDLVVVITANDRTDGGLPLTAKRILPAFIQ